MPKMIKGKIIGIENHGSMWEMRVSTGKGKIKDTVTIFGDWRPMRDGIEAAFGNPENAIGKEILFKPDSIFGATYWRPVGSSGGKCHHKRRK